MLNGTLDGVAVEDAVVSDYDVYAAAVEALESWAAKLALDVDFSDGQRSFKNSQASTALLTLADKYRAQVKPKVGRLSTLDHYPSGGTDGYGY